jgi:hypothetical protein
LRKVNWATRRWRIPSRLRTERLKEFLAKTNLRDLLGKEFVDGLEKRRDLMEGRQFRLIGLQVPLFFFLALSLVDLEHVKFSFFGISSDAVRSLREILLIVSVVLGLVSNIFALHIARLNEMLRAVIAKNAKEDAELREFLSMRYGIPEFSLFVTFDSEMRVGGWQFLLFGIYMIGCLAIVGVLFGGILAVQLLNLLAIYSHPNFSSLFSGIVIAVVVIADVITVTGFLLFKALQPYQNDEDFRKLSKLRVENESKYNEIITAIVKEHHSKGLLYRLFMRPRMKRLN